MMDASNLVWNADLTTLHGKIVPRSTATAPDHRAAIELIGPPEAIKQISVVGEVTSDLTARQVAAYMVMTLKLIVPSWPGRDRWLTDSMKTIKQRPQALTMFGWKLRMEWLPETQTITLKATH